MPPGIPSPNQRQPQSGQNPRRRKLILIVDDDGVFRRALSMKLRAFGYDVVTAEDGSAAVSVVHKAKPDLILLDLNFPPDVAHGGGLGWNGFLILNWLRRTEGAIGAPVVAVTAGDLQQYRSQCQEAGIVELMAKPIDHERLLATIRNILHENVQDADAPEPVPSTPAMEVQTARRILFVDDESGWRQMALRHLDQLGYEVLTTADAEGALREAARIRPDVIIVDLKLESGSGLRVMRLMVAAHPSVPILAYAGLGLSREAKEELLNQGAYQCLQRRSMDELGGAVQMAMEQRRRNESMELSASLPTEGPEDMLQPLESPADPEFTSVLIVEDNSDFSEMLRLYLESQSYAVTCVPNATEGLRQIEAIHFDLILCDMVLPGPSGEDFYREVERVKPDLCRRFVFMTGHDADPRTDAFIRRVHALMLWKPFPLADMLAAVQTILRKAAEERQVIAGS